MRRVCIPLVVATLLGALLTAPLTTAGAQEACHPIQTEAEFRGTTPTAKQVLGFDRDAAQLAGLVTGKEEYPPRSFRVTFEHPVYLSKGGLSPGCIIRESQVRANRFLLLNALLYKV